MDVPTDDVPFWKAKPLAAMTADEWESLCDGCAKCCLAKLEDEDTGAIDYTNVACRLLDLKTCRCTRYAERERHVPDCVTLAPADVGNLAWLPSSCAYRLLAEGRDLPWWHHLVSGDRGLVHAVGASVLGRVVSETRAGPPEHHIVTWPAWEPPR